jgi:riboflavin synthase
MFTGIIEASANIMKRSGTGLLIERPKEFADLAIGQSIAVNGACLSIVDFDEQSMRFDVVPETFSRTNLGLSQKVNLERAMPANGRFEGHVVLGHVDGTGVLTEKKPEGEGMRFTFAVPHGLEVFCVEKGSITINGISLTIASAKGKVIEIALIPHTLHLTNLGELNIGERVNLEVDYFAKLLKKWHVH